MHLNKLWLFTFALTSTAMAPQASAMTGDATPPTAPGGTISGGSAAGIATPADNLNSDGVPAPQTLGTNLPPGAMVTPAPNNALLTNTPNGVIYNGVPQNQKHSATDSPSSF